MAAHVPVLLHEVISGLNPRPGQHIADGTVGGGGHARAILEATAPDGRLLAFDRDAEALARARHALAGFGDRVTFIHASYSELVVHVKRAGLPQLDGVLLDLGLSSDQLEDQSRGFSFQHRAAPLDLRFDTGSGATAAELLNNADQRELTDIFRTYGEEPRAYKLAQAIVARRKEHPLLVVSDLLEIVQLVKGRGQRAHHPATLVWQALRLAVNHELDELAAGLQAALSVLAPAGRLAVITFHSGEDRLVKNFFKTEVRGCVCPPEFPVCRCGRHPTLKLLSRQAISPTSAEVASNPRARSAKLRLVQKI